MKYTDKNGVEWSIALGVDQLVAVPLLPIPIPQSSMTGVMTTDKLVYDPVPSVFTIDLQNGDVSLSQAKATEFIRGQIDSYAADHYDQVSHPQDSGRTRERPEGETDDGAADNHEAANTTKRSSWWVAAAAAIAIALLARRR